MEKRLTSPQINVLAEIADILSQPAADLQIELRREELVNDCGLGDQEAVEIMGLMGYVWAKIAGGKDKGMIRRLAAMMINNSPGSRQLRKGR